MENASKALLIAAAVLIVILIVTFGIKIFSSTSDTDKVAADTGKTINDKTGEATKLAINGITNKGAIDYGNKTEAEVSKGDQISIGDQRFVVIKNTGTLITAIAYKNITFNTTNPVQFDSTNNQNLTGNTVAIYNYFQPNPGSTYDFSGTPIQKCIDAYTNTLKRKGATNINSKVPLKVDLDDLSNELRNSDGGFRYITGSGAWSGYYIWAVNNDGSLFTFSGEACLRPLIEISISK